MYDTTCSSSSRPPFDTDDISLFLQHLLQPPSLPERHNHSLPPPQLSDHNRVHSGCSTDDSSGFILPTELRETGIVSSVGSGECEPLMGSAKRRKVPVENDFDCQSEEGIEGLNKAAAPSRSCSKRSRAAEVHNLSEKRRRSRINEKMKALQNLIPNSNKTDKASMLDEAIEYLKQLQLQVQMLSMRNGFSLHPMYLPGVLQPLQLPQERMGFNEGNGLPPHIHIGRDTLPVNPECPTQSSFGISNQCTTSQSMVMPPSETPYALDSSLQGGSFQVPATSDEIFREQMLRQQHFYVSQSSRNPSASLPFDERASALEQTNCGETSALHRERSHGILPKDIDNIQTLMQNLHSLQTGLSVPTTRLGNGLEGLTFST